MNITFIHPFKIRLETRPAEDRDIFKHQSPHSSSEGSEFLDEGLRMEDYQVSYTEVSISPGNPEKLL